MTTSLDMIRGRSNVVTLTNNSGGPLVAGDVCIQDTSADEDVTTTTSAASVLKVFVAAESIASGATGRFYESGYCPLVNVSASATRGYFLFTHTVAKQATTSATYAAGAFGKILKAGTSPSAIIYSATAQVAGGGTIGGATGSTDNAVIRADGTGGVTIQSSLATVDDSGGINIPTGQTYNINGSPHTHAGAGVSFYGQATITAPPAVSGFAWVNQGAATVNEASSTVYMSIPSDGSAAAHFLKKAKTGTYTITALMGYSVNVSGYQQFGFVWRESGSGKIIFYGPTYDGGMLLSVIKYTDTSGGGAAYYSGGTIPIYNNPIWLRIVVDASNRICYYSQDGLTWIQKHSIGNTDFITADEVGYGLCSQVSSAAPYGGTLFSWAEA